MKRSPWIPLVALALATSGASAQQDPLEPPDLGRFLRWGPLRARPSLALTNLGYDNNIYYRTDIPPVGDYTATVSGKVDGVVLFGRFAFLTFLERIDYTGYVQNTDQNYWNQFGSGRLTVPFRKLGFYGDFALNDYKDRPYDKLDSRTDVHETRAGGGIILKLGFRTDAELGVFRTSWTHTDPNDPTVGQSLDRTERGTRTQWRYLVFGRTRLTLETSTRDITFENPATGRNAVQRLILPGVDFGTGGRLSGSAKLGWGRLDPERADVPDYSGTIGEIKLAYRLGGGTTVLASGKRDVNFAIFDQDVYYLGRSYDLRAIHYFGRVWGVEAGGSRSRLDFPVTVDRVDRYRQVDAALRLRLMENDLGRRVEYTFRITRWSLDSTPAYDHLDQSRTVVGFGAVLGY